MTANMAQAHDAIALSYQFGRLDFISMLLAAITALIAVLALPGFLYLRYRAGQAAKEEVRKLTKGLHEKVEKEAISKMEALLPILFEQYAALAQNEVTAETADDIAEAQDDPQ